MENHLGDVRREHAASVGSGFHEVHIGGILSLRSPVTVLDFGGGLGHAYFRGKKALPNAIKWWRVVELPDVVKRGRELDLDPALTFHPDLEEALKGEIPDVVSCSGVLQTMEDSYGALRRLFNIGAHRVVLACLPIEEQERFSVFHTQAGDQIAWRILARPEVDRAAASYRLLFRGKNLPTAGKAGSDEFCMIYARDQALN